MSPPHPSAVDGVNIPRQAHRCQQRILNYFPRVNPAISRRRASLGLYCGTRSEEVPTDCCGDSISRESQKPADAAGQPSYKRKSDGNDGERRRPPCKSSRHQLASQRAQSECLLTGPEEVTIIPAVVETDVSFAGEHLACSPKPWHGRG
jgi:hypothetical protein